MPKPKQQTLVTLGVIGAVAVGVGWLQYSKFRERAALNTLREQRVFEFTNGTRKPMKGPYLERGNKDDFQFTSIDLGYVRLVAMSENGDMILQPPPVVTPGASALTDQPMTFRRADGNSQAIGTPTKVFLTPGGVLYAAYSTPNGVRILRDGKVWLDPSTSTQSVSSGFDFLKATYVTDQRAYLPVKNGKIPFLAPDLSRGEIQLPARMELTTIQASSKLGDYAVLREKEPENPAYPQVQIAKIEATGLTMLELPKSCPNPTMSISRDCLYFLPEDAQADRRLVQFRHNEWTIELPPPNTVKLEFAGGINSSLAVLFATTPPKTLQPKMPRTMMVGGPIIVRQGKYYSFDDVIDPYKGPPVRIAPGLQSFWGYDLVGQDSRQIDENGDFVVTRKVGDQLHLVILKPTSAPQPITLQPPVPVR